MEYGQGEERKCEIEFEEDGNERKTWVMVWGTRKECYEIGGGEGKLHIG